MNWNGVIPKMLKNVIENEYRIFDPAGRPSVAQCATGISRNMLYQYARHHRLFWESLIEACNVAQANVQRLRLKREDLFKDIISMPLAIYTESVLRSMIPVVNLAIHEKQIEAIAMGLHARLGQCSLLRVLDDDLIRKIVMECWPVSI